MTARRQTGLVCAALLLAACPATQSPSDGGVAPARGLAVPPPRELRPRSGLYRQPPATRDDGKTALLGGRLAMDLPAQLKTASVEDAEGETRLLWNKGEEELSLVAYELLATAPKDLRGAVERKLARGQPVRPLREGELAIVPRRPVFDRGDPQAGFTLGLVLADPERILMAVDFFVNPAAARDACHSFSDRGCTALAMSLARSITLGDRRLDLDGSRKELPLDLELELPKRWVIWSLQGADFVVSRVRQVADLGASDRGMTLYFGQSHDTTPRADDGKPIPTSPAGKGRLLGGEVEWKSWRARELQHLEAVATVREPEGDYKVDVTLWADEAGAIGEVRKIAEGMRRGAGK